MDNRITTLAENLVNYSCQVKPGDKVYVHYTGDSTRPLAKEIVKKVYEAAFHLCILQIRSFNVHS